MIRGVIHICPDCKKLVTTMLGNDADTLYVGGLICTNDGYRMRPILIDDLLVDRLLKDEVGKCQN